MPKFLQIGLQIESPLQAKGTSPDIILPNAPWVADMEAWILTLDSADMHPGDGTLQTPQSATIKLPIVGKITEKGNLFLHVKTLP